MADLARHALGAVEAVVWLVALFGAACLITECAWRVRDWLHRGEL